MRALHRPDLYSWSTFDPSRDIDFNAYAWIREGGNVLIDPLPMSSHDVAHLIRLGGADFIVLTNSDHVRATGDLAAIFGARVYGPAGERDTFPYACDRWLEDGEEVVPGMTALALDGSKTPGELALLVEKTTLITGDLVRAHRAGSLMLLPPAKLGDPARALGSVRRLADLPRVDAVLVGDGWPVFKGGRAMLRAIVSTD